jgi:hypothetical protein
MAEPSNEAEKLSREMIRAAREMSRAAVKRCPGLHRPRSLLGETTSESLGLVAVRKR